LVEPLVWNKQTGNLVGGHQRLKVLKEQGVKEVEVSVVDLSETKEKALNIALNKVQGDWDLPKLKDLLQEIDTGEFDIGITGFDEQELEQLMGQFHIEGIDAPELESGDKPNFQQMTFTLHDDQVEVVLQALKSAKEKGGGKSAMNDNSNGNAIYYICEAFLHGS
jgi:ParB-like chromosome segregation protein Spo0J